MTKQRFARTVLMFAFVATLLSTADGAGNKPAATVPDLTQGGKADGTSDWALGPIGANGWVYNQRPKNGASHKARQILITRVEKGGPSDGKLMLNDVITGVSGKPFNRDARKAFGAAIDEAEKAKNKGRLPLTVWRDGKEQSITLTLRVLGSYSDTMPFDCEKTDRIIDMACDYMKGRELKPGWLGYIDGLGLLATGREDVMPKVKELADQSHIKPGESFSVEKHVSMVSWRWSYKTVFLCEYYLATGDKSVLPTITAHANAIAMGQSGAGTWGHTYAAIENAGYLHGPLGGYGAINQMGITMLTALVLAEKCGVTNDEIHQAVKRGDAFFSYFIGRGTIPYGDHGAANHWFDDNGKSGSAAILFDLLGKQEGARFFADLVLGSTPSGREAGHTGCYWSHLWGGVGAARQGEYGLQTFFDQMNWAFTLERQADGRFVFQGNAGEGPKRGDAHGLLKGKWDSTGARLLQLCVPLRKLEITGKNTPTATTLTERRVKKIMASGALYVDQEARAGLELKHIMALLKDPLPAVRYTGVMALKEKKLECVDQLVQLLDSKDRYARYGAAEALGAAGLGNQAAADKLIRALSESKDITFQTYAIGALVNRDKDRGLLKAAKPVIPVLLKMAMVDRPDDPRGVLQFAIAEALFYRGSVVARRGLLVEYGLDGVDRDLLIPAMAKLLTNENGRGRSFMVWTYDKLGDQELARLWGDIYKSTRDLAPSGIMFASGIRTAGLKVMARNRIKEGLPLAAWYIRYQKGHGSPKRVPNALDAILTYEGHAKTVIPELKAHAEYWVSKRNKRKPVADNDPAKLILEAIKKIEAMGEPTFELVSIADQLKGQSGVIN